MASFLQRLNYHTGLFLEQPEFILEQMFHLIMRQKINYAMFHPGVLNGLGLNYTGGVLTVAPGLAIDETADADYGAIGRELLLMENLTVPLTGLTGTVWITIEYDHSLDEPKPPTSIPSRYTQKIKVNTHSANPGPGTAKILLGSIVIGTDATVPAVQKATLRLGGAPALGPTVTSFTPTTGSAGTSVTITGTNFTGATAVRFGGVAAATFTVNSATQITATVPTGAVTGLIRVTSPAGSGDSATNFTVAASPTITSFSPTSGGVGTVVTITGTNFTGATAVRFGGVAATTFTVISATQINATVPVGAATGAIRVTSPAGSGDSTTNFTVAAGPMITSFAPASGVVGTVVTITGTNFTGATAVRFGGVAATTFTVISATQINATVPTGAVTGAIRVTTPAGSGDSSTNFTVVTVPAPTLDPTNPFVPTQQFRGQSVTVRGTNFNVDAPTAPRLFIGAVQVTVTSFSAITIQFTVPPTFVPGDYPVIVRTSGGEVSSATLTTPRLFRVLP